MTDSSKKSITIGELQTLKALARRNGDDAMEDKVTQALSGDRKSIELCGKFMGEFLGVMSEFQSSFGKAEKQ